MSDSIIEISSMEQFEGAISGKKCVIDFWANWCVPCKSIAPLFDELAAEYKDLTFLKVNVEDNTDISSRYFVTSLPAIFFLDDTTVISQLIGNVDKRKIIAEIENLTK